MNLTFEQSVQKLQAILDDSKSTVFFGGAGVSTESGIPDFRSDDGLYNQPSRIPPEVMLSRSFFDKYPSDFYDFYRKKMLALWAKPNAAHLKLAEMEQKGKLDCVITQNIDGLHQMAGSEKVYELHGSVLRNYCMRCGKKYDVTAIADSEGVPRCTCGGIIKPDVVLYEEPLNDQTMTNALRAIAKADTMIIAGTSLRVYPAAGLVQYFRGNHLVIINRDETGADAGAELTIRFPVGEILSKIHV